LSERTNPATELGVSEVAIRKSLDELERQGIVRRFHGEVRINNGMVTDPGIPEEYRRYLEAAGVEVLT
jgi:DeoR/GlpR family transcriptional regulator of sugar metabolism